MRTLWQRRRGFDQPASNNRPLTCGRWSAAFDPASGLLRQIRWRGDLVLMGIYAAIRDHNWDTVPVQLSDIRVDDENDASLAVRFQAASVDPAIGYRWRGNIEFLDRAQKANAEPMLSYRFEGTAESDFRRNRIGFCVLHPTDCAGREATIETVDRRQRVAPFPMRISPHQPFKDILAISCPFGPEREVRVEMLGDTFEMEDQRNWTDASFKTYCTPLSLPFPVQIASGDSIEQTIRVSVSDRGSEGGSLQRSTSATELDLPSSGTAVRITAIGLGASSTDPTIDDRSARWLKATRPSHVRFDVDFSKTWQDQIRRAAVELATLGCRGELAVFVANRREAELESLIEAAALVDLPIRRVLVFDRDRKVTSDSTIEIAQRKLAVLGVPIGAGTDAYFHRIQPRAPNDGRVRLRNVFDQPAGSRLR